MFRLLLVAIVLEANAAPQRNVPKLVAEVLTRPTLEMLAEAVRNESTELKAAVNCAVREETTEEETAARLLLAGCPAIVVSLEAGAPPVPIAM